MAQSTLMQWFKKPSAQPIEATDGGNDSQMAHAESTDTFKVTMSAEEAEQFATARAHVNVLAQEKLPALPPNVSIQHCTEDWIQSFRRLNALLLPIQYPNGFYDETTGDQVIAAVTRVALWRSTDSVRNGDGAADAERNTKLVGAIRCRMLESPPHKPSSPEPVLYISTIGTLAPFRGLSLGSHLLEEVLRAASREFGTTAVYAHVWEANEDAMKWYQKRGFTILRREDEYYRRLAPRSSAWLIKRDIRQSDALSNAVRSP